MASLAQNEKKSLQEKLTMLDKLSDNINSKAGKKIMGRVGRDQDLKDRLSIKFIPTPSDNVNEVLGGGFPRRRTTIVAGASDSGKTSLALETIGKQMKIDPEFVAGWLESENSLDMKQIEKTFGIDPERFFYIEIDRDGAGEEALDRVEAILAAQVVDIMVINSLKCLTPSEEFKKQFNEHTVGLAARLNSKMMRKFTSIVAESDTAFLIITHLTTNIGK